MGDEWQPPAAASAAVSKVLDDDDLLIEILLRVTFPKALIRAALVCRRWLHHASDPAFLHHFRKLHPPRLLGFYIDTGLLPTTPCFIPMLPQPPDLTAVICRASFIPNQATKVPTLVRDCQNGRVLTTWCQENKLKHGVYNPLFPQRAMSIIPPFPPYQHQDNYYCIWRRLLFMKECDDLTYLYVLMMSNKESTKCGVHVYMLRLGDGVWRRHLTYYTTGPLSNYWDTKVVLIDNKIYMPSFPSSSIVVLDLMASSYSIISLPQGVEYVDTDTMLSRADDASGLYLIQMKAEELQLRIWLHKGGNWLMVDTIFMSEMVANLTMTDCTLEDEYIGIRRILQVGDNVEFVFLQMGRCVLYLDIKCRTLRKVYVMTKNKYQGYPTNIYPFKMIWPPIFPPLKDDPSRNDR